LRLRPEPYHFSEFHVTSFLSIPRRTPYIADHLPLLPTPSNRWRLRLPPPALYFLRTLTGGAPVVLSLLRTPTDGITSLSPFTPLPRLLKQPTDTIPPPLSSWTERPPGCSLSPAYLLGAGGSGPPPPRWDSPPPFFRGPRPRPKPPAQARGQSPGPNPKPRPKPKPGPMPLPLPIHTKSPLRHPVTPSLTPSPPPVESTMLIR
jgi:hypothetical protein